MSFGADYEIGARLQLRDKVQFLSGMKQVSHAVDDIGDQARQSSVALKTMGVVAAGAGKVGRIAMVGMKYAALGAGAAIAGLGYLSIKAQMDSERAFTRVENVIKSTGGTANVTLGHVEGLTKGIMEYSGIGDESVASGAGMLLSFKKIVNGVGEDAQMFDRATIALADFATFMNDGAVPSAEQMNSRAIMLGKALNDPIKGMVAMGRAGIQFSEDQQLAIAAMVESGNLMGAQKIILTELETQMGGSARAMGKTTAGQFALLKEVAGEAMETIGAAILPVANEVLPKLTKVIGPAIEKLAPVFGELAETIGKVLPGLIKAAMPFLDIFAAVFGMIGKALKPLLNMLGPILTEIFRELQPVIKPLIAALGDGLLQILKALLPVLPELVHSFLRIIKAVLPLIPILADLITLLVKIAGPMIEMTAEAFAWFVEKMAGVIEWVADFVKDWRDKWNAVRDAVVGAFNWIKDKVEPIIDWIANKVEWVMDKIETAMGFLGDLGDDLTGSFTDMKIDPVTGLVDTDGRAGGGGVEARVPYIVGERGPELMVPSTPGTVVPNESVRGLFGGPKIVQLVLDRRVIAEVVIDEIGEAVANR